MRYMPIESRIVFTYSWNADLDIHNMFQDGKARYYVSFMMEISITGCWSIWDHRNDAIFSRNTHSNTMN
jgi:hypothetical protein